MTKEDKQKIAAELHSIAKTLSKHSAIPKLEDSEVTMSGLKEFFDKYNPSAWRSLEHAYEQAVEKYQEESMGEILQ